MTDRELVITVSLAGDSLVPGVDMTVRGEGLTITELVAAMAYTRGCMARLLRNIKSIAPVEGQGIDEAEDRETDAILNGLSLAYEKRGNDDNGDSLSMSSRRVG